MRLALRLIVERHARGEGEKAGYRNGYRTGKVKTAEGAVEDAAPQVGETPEARRFQAAPRRSRIWRSNSMHAACRRATSRTPSPTSGPEGFCRARR